MHNLVWFLWVIMQTQRGVTSLRCTLLCEVSIKNRNSIQFRVAKRLWRDQRVIVFCWQRRSSRNREEDAMISSGFRDIWENVNSLTARMLILYVSVGFYAFWSPSAVRIHTVFYSQCYCTNSKKEKPRQVRHRF